MLGCVIRKLEFLADLPRPAGCKKLKGTRISGGFGLVTGVVYIVDETAKLVSIVRIADRREVYD